MSTTLVGPTAPTTPASESAPRTPVALGALWIAAGVVAFHLATARIYGYHRDEPYYLASGRRMAWGYVDHPPITPALYWFSDHVFGTSLLGLRVVPAFLHALAVFLTALLARELGATKRGQCIAALAAALTPISLTTGHFLGTVTPDIVFWAAIGIVVARLINTGDPRWWLAIGALSGCALLNKWTALLLLIGLAVGFLCTAERKLLRTPWLLAGAALGGALWAPNVWWQSQHGWPQFDAARSVQDAGDALLTIPYQIAIMGAAFVLLALPGLRWMFRRTPPNPYRLFAIAFCVIVALVMLTQGKPYYASVYFPILFAAGAAAGAMATRGLLITFVVISVLIAPFSTPLLPLGSAGQVLKTNPEIGEMIGWPELADTVATVYRHHQGATILTDNYSEAGIIELRGHALNLPQPISGQMTYWFWGHPRGRSRETVVVGFSRHFLEHYWSRVERAATFHTPHDVHNMEDGTPIWIASGQRVDWDVIWPAVRDPQP